MRECGKKAGDAQDIGGTSGRPLPVSRWSVAAGGTTVTTTSVSRSVLQAIADCIAMRGMRGPRVRERRGQSLRRRQQGRHQFVGTYGGQRPRPLQHRRLLHRAQRVLRRREARRPVGEERKGAGVGAPAEAPTRESIAVCSGLSLSKNNCSASPPLPGRRRKIWPIFAAPPLVQQKYISPSPIHIPSPRENVVAPDAARVVCGCSRHRPLPHKISVAERVPRSRRAVAGR